MALVSRETILIFILIFSICAWASFARGERFFLGSAIMLAASCAALILARTYLVHGYEDQFNLHISVTNVLTFRPTKEFIFQAVIPQALILVLLLSMSIRHSSFAVALFVSMMAVMIVGVGTGERPGGIGRAIGETLPLYAIVFLLSRFGGLPVYSAGVRDQLSSR